MVSHGRLSRKAASPVWAERRRTLAASLRPFGAPSGIRGYLLAAVAVSLATALMLLAHDRLGVLNVMLLYLLVSFGLALIGGSRAAALSAILSFLAFDFFFIPPVHKLTVARGDHVLALFVYLGISIVTGQLVARIRARTELAIREQRRTALLYELNAALIGDVGLDAILARIVDRVVHVYGATRCRLLLPDEDGALVVRAAFPATGGNEIDRQQMALAGWAFEHRAPVGRGQRGRGSDRLMAPARARAAFRSRVAGTSSICRSRPPAGQSACWKLVANLAAAGSERMTSNS